MERSECPNLLHNAAIATLQRACALQMHMGMYNKTPTQRLPCIIEPLQKQIGSTLSVRKASSNDQLRKTQLRHTSDDGEETKATFLFVLPCPHVPIRPSCPNRPH